MNSLHLLGRGHDKAGRDEKSEESGDMHCDMSVVKMFDECSV